MAMKTEEYYIIDIDGGNESIRVSLFDLKGMLILVRNQSYRTYFPQSGWAKKNPDEWWQGLCSAKNKLMNDSAVSPDRLITNRK
jgi:sugar (pentulose or hexulose) kinase